MLTTSPPLFNDSSVWNFGRQVFGEVSAQTNQEGPSLFMDDSVLMGSYVCETCLDVHSEGEMCPNNMLSFPPPQLKTAPAQLQQPQASTTPYSAASPQCVPGSPMDEDTAEDQQQVHSPALDAQPEDVALATELECILARYSKGPAAIGGRGGGVGAMHIGQQMGNGLYAPYQRPPPPLVPGLSQAVPQLKVTPVTFGQYGAQRAPTKKMREKTREKSMSPASEEDELSVPNNFTGDRAEAKKLYHIQAEKKRRSKENQLVKSLHAVLPNSSKMPVHKPVVMRAAIDYIQHLVHEELPNARSNHTMELMQEIMRLKRENAMYQARLAQATKASHIGYHH